MNDSDSATQLLHLSTVVSKRNGERVSGDQLRQRAGIEAIIAIAVALEKIACHFAQRPRPTIADMAEED